MKIMRWLIGLDQKQICTVTFQAQVMYVEGRIMYVAHNHNSSTTEINPSTLPENSSTFLWHFSVFAFSSPF